MSDNDEIFCQLLSEIGWADEENTTLARNECNCSGEIKKMVVYNDFLTCELCGTMKTAYDDGGIPMKGPSIYHVGSRTYTCYGTSTRDKGDKIADLITYYKHTINRNGHCVDPEVLSRACEIMYEITKNHIKKKGNRHSLFATLLYYTSIKMDRIMTNKCVYRILDKPDKKDRDCKQDFTFSKGMKIISKSIFCGYIEPEAISVGTKIYFQLIAKYLSDYDPEFYLEDGNNSGRNINKESNRKFCATMVEVMLDFNIAFNSIIQSKCAGVVYYFVKKHYEYKDEVVQRKYFDSIVDVGENTFMRVYNTLTSDDTQRMLRSSGKFA